MSFTAKALGSLCSHVYSGGTPTSNNEAYYGGEIPWLRTQEVTFNRIKDTDIKITEAGLNSSSAKWVPANSVIVAMYGNSAGRVAVNEIPLTTNQACCNLVIDPKVADYRYVFYALKQSYEELKGQSRGAAQNNLNASQVKAFEIPCPPVALQNAIGNILSSYDDLIENNQRRIHLLEQAARLLYKEWFVHLRFPGHEHLRIRDGVPEGWEKKTLGELAPLKYGKALKEDDRNPGPHSVYGSSGIVGTHDKALVAGPAIIVGRKGNVGSIYWAKSDFHPIDTVYYIEAENCSIYLYFALLHIQFISTDVAVPGLNRNYAHSRMLLVPDSKILALFNQHAGIMQDQIEHLTKYNQSLTQAREIMLPRLTNGELVV